MEERGYLTVATGKYYYWLAQNLYNSYILTQKERMPFAVITDKHGKKKLENVFDYVIEIVPSNNGFETKLDMGSLSPFKRTIFIDADTLLTKDISYWWKLFDNSGEHVSVFVNSWRKAGLAEPLLSEKAKKKYNLDRYLRFNGGVYYFRNTNKAHAVFHRAKSLLSTYKEDGQPLFNGKPGDEPCMEIALLENGVFGVQTTDKSQMYCTPNMSLIDINIHERYCHCVKNGEDVFPSAMHFGTKSTFGKQYRKEVIRIKLELMRIPKQFWPIVELLYLTACGIQTSIMSICSGINRILRIKK